MNLRYTLILFCILIGLGCYIKFVDEKAPSTDEAEAKSSLVLPDWSAKSVQQIRIENAKGEEISLSRNRGVWEILKPFERRGDTTTVEKILGKVQGLKYRSRFADKGETYGFPEGAVTFQSEDGGGRMLRLEFGGPAPMGDGVYLKVGGQDGIFVVNKSLKEDINQDPAAFRDPQITRLGLYEAAKAEIVSEGQKITLVKKDGLWVIEEPALGPGDQKAIDDYVRSVLYLTALRFASDNPADLSLWGLDFPWLTVSVETESKTGVKILFGKKVEGREEETYYVYESSVPTIYEVRVSANEVLKTVLDFRNKNILSVDPDSVNQVLVQTSLGSDKISLKRDDSGRWILDAKDVVSAGDQNFPGYLAEELIGLKFTQIISQDKERFTENGSGFTNPLLEIQYLDVRREMMENIKIYDAVSVSDESLLLAESSRSREIYLILRSSLESWIGASPAFQDRSDTGEGAR